MIKFATDGTRVVVTVDAPAPIAEHSFVFRWDAGSAWAARLLVHALRAAMYTRLEAIRRQAYAAGWRDAKSKKRAKEIWFSCLWEV